MTNFDLLEKAEILVIAETLLQLAKRIVALEEENTRLKQKIQTGQKTGLVRASSNSVPYSRCVKARGH